MSKKYVSIEKLGLYDEKIKKLISDSDAAALASAKEYADGLASNYDAAGSATTALNSAKSYTDGEIAKVDGTVAGVKTIAEQGVSDAAAAQGTANKAVTDAAAAQSTADAAQSDVDALERYVGTFTATEGVDTVVKYIDKKTAGIASDAALTALTERVTAAEGDIDAIEADYLKAADKTELEGKITAEENRAKGIEGGLETRLAAVEADYLKAADKTELQGKIDDVAEDVATIAGDYLKAADKTELQGKIDLKVAKADYDEKMAEVDETTESLQTQINTIMNNPDAEGAINSINEFTQYVADHGTIADGFRVDIDKNKADIAALDTAYKAADTAINGRLDVLEAIDHDAYVAADTALKNELNAEIAKKADSTALTSAVEALEGADATINGRLDVIEAQLGEGEGSVSDQIADAKAEVLEEIAADLAEAKEELKTDASNKDAVVLAEAQKAAQAVQTSLDTHTGNGDIHVTAEQKTQWGEAYTQRHTHANKDVLDGITAAKVTAWDAAEQNAKTYADGLNTAMTTKVNGVIDRVAANEGAISGINTTLASKAAQTELDSVSGRVATLETWRDNFVECSETDIADLFKQN